jgi:hypothetical protein
MSMVYFQKDSFGSLTYQYFPEHVDEAKNLTEGLYFGSSGKYGMLLDDSETPSEM